MTAHTCHAIGCRVHCEPRMLMCRACWSRVPVDIQREVYRTVKLRASVIDKTWAPWWRAAHRAIAAVARANNTLDPQSANEYLEKELAFADTLETRN